MRSRGLLLAGTIVVLAAVVGALAPAARAVDPYVVDIQACDRNGGQATVPAGVPVSVGNFAFVNGTYGLIHGFLLKQTTSQGVLRNGTLTLSDVTDAWSAPQEIGDGPARGWVTRLPNVDLTPLAAGETVLVGSLTTFSAPFEIVFPPVGLVDFGPFHIPQTASFFQGCALTAA